MSRSTAISIYSQRKSIPHYLFIHFNYSQTESLYNSFLNVHKPSHRCYFISTNFIEQNDVRMKLCSQYFNPLINSKCCHSLNKLFTGFYPPHSLLSLFCAFVKLFSTRTTDTQEKWDEERIEEQTYSRTIFPKKRKAFHCLTYIFYYVSFHFNSI